MRGNKKYLGDTDPSEKFRAYMHGILVRQNRHFFYYQDPMAKLLGTGLKNGFKSPDIL